jgi:hypothetical protein
LLSSPTISFTPEVILTHPPRVFNKEISSTDFDGLEFNFCLNSICLAAPEFRGPPYINFSPAIYLSLFRSLNSSKMLSTSIGILICKPGVTTNESFLLLLTPAITHHKEESL